MATRVARQLLADDLYAAEMNETSRVVGSLAKGCNPWMVEEQLEVCKCKLNHQNIKKWFWITEKNPYEMVCGFCKNPPMQNQMQIRHVGRHNYGMREVIFNPCLYIVLYDICIVIVAGQR